jgi:hypothetical protein
MRYFEEPAVKIKELIVEVLPLSSPAEYAPMVRQAITAPPTPMNPYQGLSAAASEFETSQQSMNPDGIAGTETSPVPPTPTATPIPASTGPTSTGGFPQAGQPIASGAIGEAMTWADYVALSESTS